MAVVIKVENKDEFIDLAREENLEATHVATVTDTGYMRMFWNDKAIVNLQRYFIETSGVKQTTTVHVDKVDEEKTFFINKKQEAVCELVVDEDVMKQLIANGQIATQYVDLDNNPTYDIEFNPNGSFYGVQNKPYHLVLNDKVYFNFNIFICI